MFTKNISERPITSKKKLILAILAITAISGTTALGIDKASANTNSDITLVQIIAQKFNLNQNDVQSTVDQYRQEHQAQMGSQFKTKLDQDVAAGKITAAQETLIINKRQELANNRAAQMANFKTMTQADRQAALQKNKQDLTDWAKQNGIDVRYLFGGFGRMGGGHDFSMRGGHGAGMRNNQ